MHVLDRWARIADDSALDAAMENLRSRARQSATRSAPTGHRSFLQKPPAPSGYLEWAGCENNTCNVLACVLIFAYENNC